jgi:hypothetical protein
MAFEMKKGNAMHRNFPGAFKDVAKEGETKQHPEHHFTTPNDGLGPGNRPMSKGNYQHEMDKIWDPNKAGIDAREQKRGNSGVTISGGHGSTSKDKESEFTERKDVSQGRDDADKGSGSLENINLLPEAEVVAPSNKEERKEQKDQFKAALEAWKQGGKEGKRPKRKDYK